MKKLISILVLTVAANMAVADDAATAQPAAPAVPAVEAATPAAPNKEERKKMREEKKAARKAMREEHKAMHEQMKAEGQAQREKTKAACSADAATAGCTQEPGEGLMKCLHAYKKSNADFKMSEGCMASAKEGHEMHQDRKMKRKAMKHQRKGGTADEAAPVTQETK